MWAEPLPNGKYKFAERYEDPLTGEQKKVSITMDRDTASTRKQAQAALQDKISVKVDKLLSQTKKDDLRLSELVNLYRADQLVSVSKPTYKRNYHTTNTIMRLLGESTIVSRLTAGYVKKKFTEHGESPGTFNERLSRYKALIRWGYENDYIADIRYLDKIKPLNNREKKERLQDKFLEASDLKKLLEAMKVQKWRYLSEFMALSGLRCGEAIALNMGDIDFKTKTITVSKTYDPTNKVINSPKTLCSNREVYMQPELEALCRKIHLFTLSGQMKYGYRTDLFLCNINGDYLEYYAYNKYLKELAQRTLHRDNITTHIMRHTHVSLLAEAGVPLEAITRRVGHVNSDITKRIYLHVTEKLKEKEREQIRGVNIL